MPPWLRNYQREALSGDVIAGVIVALMMVPQAMAYALVIGLPPVTGLYASLLPAFAYALLGSSRVQSVGPMAIVSLMTGAAVAPFAPAGSGLHLALAAMLATLAGLLLLAGGLLKLGFVANFLSRPVLTGFTAGAAVLIAGGQVRLLLGLPKDAPLAQALAADHAAAPVLGLSCMAALWLARTRLTPLLKRCGLPARAADLGGKLAPVLVLIAATFIVAAGGEAMRNVPSVGPVPSGLPTLRLDTLQTGLGHAHQLLIPGALIAFMVFLSSQSAALPLAQKRNERIDSNRELLGLGAANVLSAMSGAFPVTGSISRSAVNAAAGAQSPLASLVTAVLIGGLLLLPAPALAPLAWLPLPALAALIVVAVLGMIDIETARTAWRHDRADAAALLVTLGSVIGFGVERGVVIGVVLSFATLTWRSSRPHIAVIGRVPATEHFRSIARHQVQTLPCALFVRVDAALMFGNTQSVLERLEAEMAARPEARHLVLVMSAVNEVDTSGLYMLLSLNRALGAQGKTLHLAEIKGPVMDRLRDSRLLLAQLSGRVHLSANEAFAALALPTH